jgi:SAM-dependent methyltransferase
MSAEAGPSDAAGHWDHFWHRTHMANAAQGCGATDPALGRFWRQVFGRYLVPGKQRRLLDLACGDGAVTGFAMQADHPPDICCALDYSTGALLEARKRHPAVLCVAADAAVVPCADQSFELVCSQFGIEYAGPEAVLAAGPLVAPGGVLALVAHMQGGVIDKESRLSLRAIAAMQKSNVLPLARRAFETGFALNQGTGGIDALKAAERPLTAAMTGLQQLLARLGTEVAAGLAHQVYTDISVMYSRMAGYDPDEVFGWIDGMMLEIEAFRGRMTAMTNAAIDKQALERLVTRFAARGLKPRMKRSLPMGDARKPGAWTLVLERI